jgi:hypothetical protein
MILNYNKIFDTLNYNFFFLNFFNFIYLIYRLIIDINIIDFKDIIDYLFEL